MATFKIVSGRLGDGYYVDGVAVARADFYRLFAADKAKLPQVSEGRLVGKKGHGWPKKSFAIGVHPAQRQEAIDQASALGVPTDFDGEGRAVLTDRAHRKRIAKALGYHDCDGGYGD